MEAKLKEVAALEGPQERRNFTAADLTHQESHPVVGVTPNAVLTGASVMQGASVRAATVQCQHQSTATFPLSDMGSQFNFR